MTHFLNISMTVLALALLAAPLARAQTQLTIDDQSRMWVDGTSTVHDWTCEVGQVDGAIALDEAGGKVSKAAISVVSASIECDSGTMNKKAASALRIRDYPTIQYTMTAADATKDGEELRIEARGALELVGVSREVRASLIGRPIPGGFAFEGTLPLKMSDFNINPPTAMLGVLKTGNDVTVRFELVTVSAGLTGTQ